MTVGDAGVSGARQDDPDDVGLDVAYYARLLWRYRLLIALVTIAGAAGGWLMSRTAARVYVGTAGLRISQAQGSVAAADAVVKYQIQLDNQNVLEAALKDLGLDRPPANATAANLRSAVSSRVEPSTNLLIVEASWSDPDLAARIARAVAQKAFDAAQEQEQKAAILAQSVLRGQIEDVSRVVAQTQSAVLDFRQKSRTAVGPEASDVIEAQRRELAAVLAEIPAERARLGVARDLLARTEPTVFLQRFYLDKPVKFEVTNPVHTGIAGQVVDSQARLAALAAKRDFYTRSEKARAPESTVEAEITHTRLQVAARQAQQTLTQLSDAMSQAAKAIASPNTGLQVTNGPMAPGRRVSRSTSAHVARGLAIGLVLSVFGVLFFHGLAASTFGRRT